MRLAVTLREQSRKANTLPELILFFAKHEIITLRGQDEGRESGKWEN